MHNRAVIMSDKVIMNTAVLKIIDETLRFQLIRGGVLKSDKEYHTKWLMLPVNVIAFLVQGRGEVTFWESEEVFPVRPGDAIIAPKGMIRRNLFFPENGNLIIVWAHLQYDIMQGFDLLRVLQIPKVLRGKNAVNIGHIIKKIVSKDYMTDRMSVKSISAEKALGMELLALLANECEFKADAPALLNQYRTQSDIIGYIESHLSEKITVEHLAKQSHLSVSRFHRVFKGATGRSPADFIIDRRIQAARRLLAATAMSLSEIAEATGFSNVYYFSRMFKRLGGSSPSAYRKSLFPEDEVF